MAPQAASPTRQPQIASTVATEKASHISKAPLTADDKFLALAGYLLAALIAYRATPLGTVLMIALLVWFVYLACRDEHSDE